MITPRMVVNYKITYKLNGNPVTFEVPQVIEMDHTALSVNVFRHYLRNKIGRGFRGANDYSEEKMWKQIAKQESDLADNGEVRVSSDYISDMEFEEV